MIIVVRSGLTSDLALSHDVQIDVIIGFGAHLCCRHAYLNVCMQARNKGSSMMKRRCSLEMRNKSISVLWYLGSEGEKLISDDKQQGEENMFYK